jgi:hypothetical protein
MPKMIGIHRTPAGQALADDALDPSKRFVTWMNPDSTTYSARSSPSCAAYSPTARPDIGGRLRHQRQHVRISLGQDGRGGQLGHQDHRAGHSINRDRHYHLQRHADRAAHSAALHRAWLFVALRGRARGRVAAVVLTRPGMGGPCFVTTLGGYLFIDGLLALGISLRAEKRAPAAAATSSRGCSA